MSTMTRDEIKEFLGDDLLESLDASKLYISRRILEPHQQDLVEFIQEINFTDDCGSECIARAYHYQDKENVESCDDMSNLHWEYSDEYEII